MNQRTQRKFVLAAILTLTLIANVGCDDFKKEKDKGDPRVVYTDTYIVRENSKITDLMPSVSTKSVDGNNEPIVINAEELILKDGATLFIEDKKVIFNVKRFVSENGKISTFDPALPEPTVTSPDLVVTYLTIEYGKSGGSITINTADAEGTLSVEMYGMFGQDGLPREYSEFSCGFDTPCANALDGFKGENGTQNRQKCVKQPQDGTDGAKGRRGRDGVSGSQGGGSGSGSIIVTGKNSMKIEGTVTPGVGGLGGKGMLGQLGGKGGPPGDVTFIGEYSYGNYKNICRQALWGRPGDRGDTGSDGHAGESGFQGKFCLLQNDVEQICVPNK